MGCIWRGYSSFITKTDTRVQTCATDFSLICSDRWCRHRNADGCVHQSSALQAEQWRTAVDTACCTMMTTSSTQMSKPTANFPSQTGSGFILCCEAVASFTVFLCLLLKLKVDGWCQGEPERLVLHPKAGKALTLNSDTESATRIIKNYEINEAQPMKSYFFLVKNCKRDEK